MVGVIWDVTWDGLWAVADEISANRKISPSSSGEYAARVIGGERPPVPEVFPNSQSDSSCSPANGTAPGRRGWYCEPAARPSPTTTGASRQTARIASREIGRRR